MDDPLSNLNPIMLFAGCVLPMVATPIGVIVAVLVCRFMPLVSILAVTVVAAYVVAAVILFVLFRRLLPDEALNIYAAAFASLVVAAGAEIFIVCLVHRRLFARQSALAAAQNDAQTFSVFGEDVRARRKTRRKP